MTKLRILGLTLLLLLGLAEPVRPAVGSFVSQLGFGGYTVPGRWTPLRIRLTGGNSGMRLEILHRELGGVQPAVESFPYRSDSWVECPVFVGESSLPVTLRLVDNRQILAEERLDLYRKTFPGHLVLTASLSSPVRRSIETAMGPLEPVLTVPVDVLDMPTVDLSYDGVAGLAMLDPGPVLNPAQITALRGWLASGGHLVLIGNLSDSESLRSLLLKEQPPPQPGKTVQIPLGFGGITLLDSTDPVRENWRTLLSLRPYLQTLKLSAGLLADPPGTIFKAPQSEPASPYYGVALVLLLWYGAMIFISFAKRNRGILLGCFTLLCLTLALPGAVFFGGGWQRGARVQYHAILLPGADRALVDIGIKLDPFNLWDLSRLPVSPWGVDVAFGRYERGVCRREGEGAVWEHHRLNPELMLRTGSMGRLGLFGSVRHHVQYQRIPDPRGSSRGLLIPSDRQLIAAGILWWDGRQFRSFQPENEEGQPWQRTETPEWLKENEGWLNYCHSRFPDLNWIIGRGDCQDFKLRVGTGPVREVLWLIPIREG